jgi:hypothetical protein
MYFTVQFARSNIFLDERSDDFDIRDEQHDGSLAVLLKRPDGTNPGVNLPPSSDIFKDIGGATRKTEEKNPPLQLLEVLVVAGWNVFLDDKQSLLFPFDWIGHQETVTLTMCKTGCLSLSAGVADKIWLEKSVQQWF